MRNPTVLVFATQHMVTGGIESHLRQFCLHLSESGVEIDLVIPNCRMLPEARDFFQRTCRQLFTSDQKNSLARHHWLLFTALRLKGNHYDALYSNGQGNSIYFFRKLIGGELKWVHHHHTSGDEADRKTWSVAYRWALQKADVVVACSNRNAMDMKSDLLRPIATIPCFSRQVSGIESIARPKPRFGYFGRLIPEKGIQALCDLSADPDLNLIEIHIWGEGDAYPEPFFRAYPNLHYHGPFSGEKELDQVILSLDAFLLLSTNPEGLPISLLEVMSAGLPWLATDRGGIPDIACDTLSTRVIPSSSGYGEYKKAILALAHDLQLSKISRSVQKAFYLNKYAPHVLIREWREILGIAHAIPVQQKAAGNKIQASSVKTQIFS